MPWLDTCVESIIKYSQIFPAWIHESNLELLSTDMPWLDTRIESGIDRLQICPGWMQESNLELLSSDVPWLDTGIESGIVVYRYALAGYRNQIWNCCQLIDMPWLDTWIESSNSSDVPWLDTGIESGNVVNRYALAGYRNRIWNCNSWFVEHFWHSNAPSGDVDNFLACYRCWSTIGRS